MDPLRLNRKIPKAIEVVTLFVGDIAAAKAFYKRVFAPEIVYEDDQFKPDVGKQRSEKLVQQDKVSFVAGYYEIVVHEGKTFNSEASLDEVLERVERSWRKPRKLLEAGPRDLEQLHELRLALKHYRYALEPVAGVAPREAARLLRRLRAAQDRLGEHRDLVLAREWVDEHAESLGRVLVRRLKRLVDQRTADLLDEIIRCIRRVVPAQDRWRRASRRFRSAGTAGPG